MKRKMRRWDLSKGPKEKVGYMGMAWRLDGSITVAYTMLLSVKYAKYFI